MRKSTFLVVFLILLRTGAAAAVATGGSPLSVPIVRVRNLASCTDSLAAADADDSGGLSLEEFTSFLKQKNAKHAKAHAVDTKSTIGTTVENSIQHVFSTFPTLQGTAEVDITGAAATDLAQVSPSQQAVLELICERSQALLLSTTSSHAAKTTKNNPFQGEQVAGSRQGLPEVLEHLFYQVGGVDISWEDAQTKCPTQFTSLFQCVLARCPNLLDVCYGFQVSATGRVAVAVAILGKQAAGDTGAPICSADGDTFTCNQSSQFNTGGTQTDVESTITCDINAALGFDVQQSDNCACSALLTTDGVQRACSCGVCSQGSPQSLSVDCSANEQDPFVFEPCIALDCDGRCIQGDTGTAGSDTGTAATGGDTASNGAVGTCSDIQNDFCGTVLAGDDCCMTDCAEELADVTTCAILQNTGEDCQLSECDDVDTAGSGGDSSSSGGPMFLDGFVLNVAGLTVDASTAETDCPSEWAAMVQCIITDCPYFLEVCSDPTQGFANATVPSCQELDEALCSAFAGTECCMAGCAPAVQLLLACLFQTFTGEDLSVCEVTECDSVSVAPSCTNEECEALGQFCSGLGQCEDLTCENWAALHPFEELAFSSKPCAAQFGADGETSFCSPDGSCFEYSCENWYQYGPFEYTGYDGSVDLTCTEYTQGDQENMNSVVFGCRTYKPGFNSLDGRTWTHFFNRECTANGFTCYDNDDNADFRDFQGEAARVNPGSCDPEMNVEQQPVYWYNVLLGREIDGEIYEAELPRDSTGSFSESRAKRTMYAVFSGDEEYDSPSGSDGTGGGGLQDLDEFTFNVAGISIDAETVQEACPDEFDMTFQCIIRDCPFFLDVCPNFTEDLGSGMADTVPSCEELDQGLCDLYGGEPECCITDCFTELQGLLVCAISELTGEDRSDCAAPTCATSTSDSGGGGGGPNDMDEGGGLLDTFDVWFAGVQIDASVAENACPVEWLVLVTTVITQCPNFLDVCPSALEGSPGNSDNNGAVPACPAFNQQICRELDFQKQDPGCCLDVATYQLYDLTLCIIRETTGEDLSTCGLPDCVTAATALPEGGHDGADIGDAFVGALTSAINITGFDVDIFGTKLSPALNIDIPECNYDWFWTLGCIKEQCSNFLEVCRDPNAAPNTNVSFVMGGASPQTCTELETGICDPLSRFPVGCCFSDCILPLYTLASCVVDNAIPDKEIRECRPPCLVDWLVGPGLQLAGAVPPTAEDLALFEFDFFGKNLTGRDAEAQCNDETSKTIDCVKKDCPNFFWSCARDLAGFPYAVNTDPDALFSSSAAPLDLTPANFGCTNFTDTFCELFKVSEACCLSKCMAPMYDLAACMIDFAIGDNSNLAGGCSAPQCVADYGDAYNPSVGIIPVAVNSSFLISTLETITAAALLAQLNDGDNVALQVLLDAYRACVQAAVDSLNTDSGGRQLGHLPTVDGIPHRQLQTLPPEFDPNSAEIYNFMDTPCDDTSATVSKQGGGTAQQQQQTCITVFGKYKLSVDPQDNPQAVYERFEEATTTAISTGVLQDKLQEAAAVQANNNVGNATNNTAASFVSPFVVQGVSTVVDESFVAISPLEIPATPDASRPELGATDNATGNTGTNNATAAPTEAPDSGASSLWRSAATALLAIPFCIALLS